MTEELPSRPSDSPRVLLRVLASGSTGNCSVLVFEARGVRRVCLIDLGLSPKQTFRVLAGMGIRADQIDDAILTHLDHDHAKTGWRQGLPPHARLHVHRSHAGEARRMGLRDGLAKFTVFEEDFDLTPGVRVRPIIMSHDDEGVVAFRFDLDGFGGSDDEPASAEPASAEPTNAEPSNAGVRASLGFATDLGCVTSDLVEHLYAVDVLAIESNYCPRRQMASSRPDYLKNRIMGGRGHLSNELALEAIHGIEPREHVVLLHLSRECNCPEQVRAMHEGADYALTISEPFTPTRWVRVCPTMREAARSTPEHVGTALRSATRDLVRVETKPATVAAQAMLF